MRAVALLLVFAACGRTGFDPLAIDDALGGGVADAGDEGDAATVDGAGGDAANVTYTASFVLSNGFSPPPPRRSSGAALEPSSPERLWIYGGYDSTFRSDLHVYVPSTNMWTAPAAAGTSPGTRERHALAWDPVGNALVSFGGQNRPMIQLVHYDTLHVFSAGTWSQIPKSGSWPAARKDSTLIWIPHLSKFLLYGGNSGANAASRFSDIWHLTLNVTAMTAVWELQTTTGATPPAQSAACVVYDPAARRVLVYGGETADGVDVNTTHQYLVDSRTWVFDTTTGVPHAGESFAQCSWDPASAKLLIYGGQQNGGDPIGGFATYDPNTFVWNVPQATTAAAANRADGSAVYSPSAGGLLWYGGRTGTTVYTSELVLMKLDAQ